MFVETWFIFLGEHGKTKQFMWFEWFKHRNRIFKTLFGSCTEVATFPWDISDIGWFSINLFSTHFSTETFGGQLQGPFMNQHIADVNSFWSHLDGMYQALQSPTSQERRCWRRSNVLRNWLLFFFGCWIVTKIQQRLWELILKSPKCLKCTNRQVE